MEDSQNKKRSGGKKLDRYEKPQAVVAIHHGTSKHTKHKAGHCFAQVQDRQGHDRVGDLVSHPIERNLRDGMANGRQKVTGPKEGIVFVK